MIPLSLDQKLVFEKDSVKLSLNYLTLAGESQYEQYLAKMDKALEVANEGDKKLKGITEEQYKENPELAIIGNKAINQFRALSLSAAMYLIPLFVNEATFSNGEVISGPDCLKRLRSGDLLDLADMVKEKLPELIGDEVDEVKN